ncbi:pentapeptide repeat-containing protein [Microbispora rosea]|uniref:pentapeptide repeat-containing protein n=1 Tax=Microbispora rosea TaxID=58117 RepID=UPI0004C330AA|nr:pentapeptide repeat-containing protein [Microbispora rosea]
MPKRREQHRREPRELGDLPYADHLEPFDGRLSQGGDYDTVLFDGQEFEDADAGGARFMESAFTSVTFTGGRYRRARFSDVWMNGVRWVGGDLTESVWVDAEIVMSAPAGTALPGAEMHQVFFHRCKLDSVNLRAADLREVSFVECTLRDVDFAGATLTGVDFPGSTLERVRFDKARMSRVDLRGAVSLGISDGYDALRGATVSGVQLMELAPMFAHVLGVTVDDG